MIDSNHTLIKKLLEQTIVLLTGMERVTCSLIILFKEQKRLEVESFQKPKAT